MTPLERLKAARDHKPAHPIDAYAIQAEPPAAPPAPPDGSRTVRLFSGKVPRRPDPSGQHLEKRWQECLSYPFRAARLCLGLAMILTVLSAGVAMILPRLLAEPPEGPYALVAFHAGWIVVVLVLAGLPCGFLEAVLESASAGEVYYIRWSGNLPGTVVFGSVRWLLCFLAGPIVFAAAGLTYWLACGDLLAIDWLIVTELCLVAIGYQIYALLAMTDRGRLRDVNPLAVADLAHRLSWRGLAGVLVASLFVMAHGVLLLAALPEVHHGTLVGWVLLAAVWASAVFLSTFFCRLLGIWVFRSRKKARPVEPAEPAEPAE